MPTSVDNGSLDSYNAVRRLRGLRLTIKLIPVSLDVVQSIGDHDGLRSQYSLDSRVFRSPRILLGACFGVDLAGEA